MEGTLHLESQLFPLGELEHPTFLQWSKGFSLDTQTLPIGLSWGWGVVRGAQSHQVTSNKTSESSCGEFLCGAMS